MQNSKENALKARIVKGVKKDRNELLEELITAGGENDKLAQQLAAIELLIEKDAGLRNERKQLSRRIGQAKKTNQSAEDLIKQVSQLSQELEVLDLALKEQIESIQSDLLLPNNSRKQADPQWPQHLRQRPDAENSELSPSSKLLLEIDQPIDPAEWRAFVDSVPHATLYHDHRWRDVLQRNFKYRIHTITCRDQSGKLIGVLPVSHLNSSLFGSFTISMPYFNYGGPLAQSLSVDEAMLKHAKQLSEDLGCTHMEIRETRDRKHWQGVQRKVSMVLPLPKTDNELENKLGSKLRAQVKKARSHQLHVEFGGIEKVDDFYKVFSRNMRDLGTPVYSKKIFADILETFSDLAFLCVVYKGEEPLAVGFLLGFRDKLEIPWASSIRRYNHLGANMLMYRSILSEAISRNYQYFDFGRSSKGASTYKFKRQWGANEHQLYWHYWVKGDQDVPEINPDNKKYQLMIKVWQNLPVWVTKLIGPPIARSLP